MHIIWFYHVIIVTSNYLRKQIYRYTLNSNINSASVILVSLIHSFILIHSVYFTFIVAIQIMYIINQEGVCIKYTHIQYQGGKPQVGELSNKFSFFKSSSSSCLLFSISSSLSCLLCSLTFEERFKFSEGYLGYLRGILNQADD